MGGQDAHATRKLILCGTGILPVLKNGVSWFPGRAWEPMSRGSASLSGKKWRQSLRICVPRLSLGTRKTRRNSYKFGVFLAAFCTGIAIVCGFFFAANIPKKSCSKM